jgi:hypothetical protein
MLPSRLAIEAALPVKLAQAATVDVPEPTISETSPA